MQMRRARGCAMGPFHYPQKAVTAVAWRVMLETFASEVVSRGEKAVKLIKVALTVSYLRAYCKDNVQRQRAYLATLRERVMVHPQANQ